MRREVAVRFTKGDADLPHRAGTIADRGALTIVRETGHCFSLGSRDPGTGEWLTVRSRPHGAGRRTSPDPLSGPFPDSRGFRYAVSGPGRVRRVPDPHRPRPLGTDDQGKRSTRQGEKPPVEEALRVAGGNGTVESLRGG